MRDKDYSNEIETTTADIQKKEKPPKQPFRAFVRAMPWIMFYNIIMGAVFMLVLAGLRRIGMLLIYSTGRVAVTSGDFRFLFSTWQGWLILLLVVVVMFLAVTIEINGLLLLCDKAVRGERIRIFAAVKDALRSIRLILNKDGLLISIYIAIAAPLTGIGFTLSETAKAYIPDFIASVIWATPLYLAIYLAIMAFLIFFGIRNLFLLPYLVIDHLPPKEAVQKAHQMMKDHWKDFFLKLILMSIRIFLIVGLITLAAAIISAIPQFFTDLTVFNRRFLMIASYSVIMLFIPIIISSVPAMQVLEIVRLYTGYKENRTVIIPSGRTARGRLYRLGVVISILVVIVISACCAQFFDELFPAESGVKVIAHRLGGNEAPENSLEGWKTAWENGAVGFETDIQRAKDGTYVINHDAGFKRTCGVDKKVPEMTWKQIRKLRIKNPDGTKSEQHPPSLEELLDDVKEKTAGHEDTARLYLELKGKTADKQMADDVVSMVREKGMEDQCTIISLKYELVAYVEQNYPELETGYLYFFSYGDRAALNCDALIMEEESATPTAIESIHAANKAAIVWTINKESSAAKVLSGNADAVITDEISMCQRVREKLAKRSDYVRFTDAIRQ